jgi:hypothetical protein
MHARSPGAPPAATGRTTYLSRPSPAFTAVWVSLQLMGWLLLAAAVSLGWSVNLRGALLCVIAGTFSHALVGGMLGARAVQRLRRWSSLAGGATLVALGVGAGMALDGGLLLDIGVAGVGLVVGGVLARILGACR